MAFPTPANIVRDDKAQLDFSQSTSYGDYLQLGAILGARYRCIEFH